MISSFKRFFVIFSLILLTSGNIQAMKIVAAVTKKNSSEMNNELLQLRLLEARSFDEISLKEFAQTLLTTKIFCLLDELLASGGASQQIDDDSVRLNELFNLIGDHELFSVLEHSELMSTCDNQETAIKFSQLLKLCCGWTELCMACI